MDDGGGMRAEAHMLNHVMSEANLPSRHDL